MGAQLVADQAKRLVELGKGSGVVVLPASIFRNLDERVLPAGVTACAGLHRNYDDAIDDRFRLLRRTTRTITPQARLEI